MTRLLGVRDSMMADNLVALADRGPVFVHAHNLHLKREKAVMGMWQGRMVWWGAGSLAHARLGTDYAFLEDALVDRELRPVSRAVATIGFAASVFTPPVEPT